MKERLSNLSEGIHRRLFAGAYALAKILGRWDRTWTGDCRLFAMMGLMAAEHCAHDGRKTVAWGVGNMPAAMLLAESLTDWAERLWAARVSDFELLTGLRRTHLLRQDFDCNKAVAASLDRCLKTIHNEVSARGLSREAANATSRRRVA